MGNNSKYGGDYKNIFYIFHTNVSSFFKISDYLFYLIPVYWILQSIITYFKIGKDCCVRVEYGGCRLDEGEIWDELSNTLQGAA